MNIPIVWRLLYADGSEITEDPANTMSICNSKPNPIEMHVLRASDMQPLVRVELRGYVPIWYRKMHMDMRPNELAPVRNIYTVFGRARDAVFSYDGQCWIYDGQIRDCPSNLIEENVIANLVEHAGGR